MLDVVVLYLMGIVVWTTFSVSWECLSLRLQCWPPCAQAYGIWLGMRRLHILRKKLWATQAAFSDMIGWGCCRFGPSAPVEVTNAGHAATSDAVGWGCCRFGLSAPVGVTNAEHICWSVGC